MSEAQITQIVTRAGAPAPAGAWWRRLGAWLAQERVFRLIPFVIVEVIFVLVIIIPFLLTIYISFLKWRANRPFEQTREHDGRIVELVVLDVAKMLNKRLNGRAILLRLSGISGGAWRIGNGDPIAEMEMDVLDFNIFVSGRYSYEEGMSHARISGDRTLIENAFKDFLVLY